MVEILKMNGKGYYFQLKAKSGSSLLMSEFFPSAAQAKGMIKQLQANPLFERKTNYEGKFLIHLKLSDGRKIAESKTFSSEAGMENGLKNLQRILSSAIIA